MSMMSAGLSFITFSVSAFAMWAATEAFLHSAAGARLQLWFFEQRNRWYQFRLRRRLQAGEDRYFEELRAIEASAPRPPDLERPVFKHWRTALRVGLLIGCLNALEAYFF